MAKTPPGMKKFRSIKIGEPFRFQEKGEVFTKTSAEASIPTLSPKAGIRRVGTGQDVYPLPPAEGVAVNDEARRLAGLPPVERHMTDAEADAIVRQSFDHYPNDHPALIAATYRLLTQGQSTPDDDPDPTDAAA